LERLVYKGSSAEAGGDPPKEGMARRKEIMEDQNAMMGGGQAMKWMYQFSFYHRIQILLILFILLPIIVTAVISYVIITRQVTERIQETNQQVIEAMNTDLTRAIEDITFSSNYLAVNHLIQDTLMDLKDTTSVATFHDYRAIQDLSEFINVIDAKLIYLRTQMFVVNPKGYVVFFSTNNLQEVHSLWSQMRERIQPNNYQTMQWLGPIQEDGPYREYYGVRVIRHKATGELLGTLVINLPRSYFETTFGIMKMGQLSVYDASNRLIIQTKADGFNPKEVEIREESVNRFGWKIVHEVSESELTGNISGTFYWFFLLIGSSFIVLMLISIGLARGLNRPLHNLHIVAQRFGSGNLDVRFPVRGKDEVAALGNAFNAMLDQIQRLISNIEHEQEEKRMIELQSLFAQIQPHFLINTLNSVKLNLAMSGDQLHSGQIDSLMNLLRGYLKVHEPSTLVEECRLTKHYLDIMQMRSDIPIDLVVEVPEELESFMVPRLLLQPIVENAVVHGFAERERDAEIYIGAERQEEEIVLLVSDNGSGMSEAQCEEINRLMQDPDTVYQANYSRVGLLNVAKRVRLTYGVQSWVEVYKNRDAGITFVIHIKQN
jgi:two-component system, sensor histidine kinase YesM